MAERQPILSGAQGAEPGIGCASDSAQDEPKERSVEAQNELEQLDESLSEMTDLLLSADADGPELDGDFGSPRTDPPPATAADDPVDLATEVEEAQAAVAAAMGKVADAIEGAGELPDRPAGDDPALPEPVDRSEPRGPHDAGPGEALAAAAASLESVPPDPAAPATVAETSGLRTAAPSPAEAPPAPPATTPVEAGAGQVATAAPDTSESAHRASGASASAAAGGTARAAHARPRGGQALLLVASGIGSLIAIGLEPVAARLAGSSRTLRHSIAWLAVWTAFNAACVWTYLILFRSTPPGPAERSATEIVGAAEALGVESDGPP